MILLSTLFVNAFLPTGEELSTKRCSECRESNMLHTFDREGVGKPRFQGRSNRGETLATRIIQG